MKKEITEDGNLIDVCKFLIDELHAVKSRLEATEIELLSVNSSIDFFVDTQLAYNIAEDDDKESEIGTYIPPKKTPAQLPAPSVPIHLDIMGLDFSDNIRNRQLKKLGKKLKKKLKQQGVIQ